MSASVHRKRRFDAIYARFACVASAVIEARTISLFCYYLALVPMDLLLRRNKSAQRIVLDFLQHNTGL